MTFEDETTNQLNPHTPNHPPPLISKTQTPHEKSLNWHMPKQR